MADVDTQDLWAKWLGAVQAAALPAGLGEGQRFSAGSTTLNVDLGNADPTIQNYYIHGLGDVVPANSPSYSAGSSLVSAYAAFLDWIDPGAKVNPNLDSQVNLATTKLNNAQKAFNAILMQAITAYNAAKGVMPDLPAFKDWLPTNYPSYLTANNDLIGASGAYEQLMIQVYGPNYASLQNARTNVGYNYAQNVLTQNKFNMAVTSGSVSPPGSQPVVIGGDTPAAPSALVSSFLPAYSLQAFGSKYPEWQAASVAGQNDAGASISITSNTEDYSLDKSGWSASAKATLFGDFFNFSLGGSTSGGKTSINTSSSDFSLTVDFTGFGSFPIAPGAWWNSALVALNTTKLKPGAPDFFGDDGALSGLATQVVVGFEPTVTLKMSASDYSNVKSTWQAQATTSIGIGPFRLGKLSGSANGTKQDIHYDDATASVTIGPVKSTLPVLLGVVSQRLGGSQDTGGDDE